MSRIFEALQKAETERKSATELGDVRPGQPAAVPVNEASQPACALVDLENVAKYTWAPSTAFLPTLLERGEGVERFRSLRSRIYQFRFDIPLKTILISSGAPSEGKSFVAANLAMTLARNNNNKVLLIDADLRRPVLHKVLGAPNVPGLSEYLAGSADLHAIFQRDGRTGTPENARAGKISNLTFIPAGTGSDNSSELVANHRFEDLIAAISSYFDWILIDSPPVLAVTDAVELARAADAVLLVARGGTTPYEVAQRAQATLSNSRILGFVLNDVKDAPRGESYYNYYGIRDESSEGKAHSKKERHG